MVISAQSRGQQPPQVAKDDAGGAGMSVPKTVLAEMAGVNESEVRCDNCGRGDTGILVDCHMWGSVVAGGGFCSMWCKREEVQE